VDAELVYWSIYAIEYIDPQNHHSKFRHDGDYSRCRAAQTTTSSSSGDINHY